MSRNFKVNPRFRVKIKKTLKRLPSEARTGAADALRTNGEEAVRIIRGDAPAGRIAKSVQWGFHSDPNVPRRRKSSPAPDDLRISVYAGGKTAPHAHLVHFGTRQRSTGSGANRGAARPQPFFYPNIRSLKKRHVGRISRKANAAIRAAAKRGSS